VYQIFGQIASPKMQYYKFSFCVTESYIVAPQNWYKICMSQNGMIFVALKLASELHTRNFPFFPVLRNAMKVLFETEQQTGPKIAYKKFSIFSNNTKCPESVI